MMKKMLFLVLTIPSCLLADPPAIAEKQVDPEIPKLINKAEAARESAVKAIPRARGSGTHSVTIWDKHGKIQRKERSKFWMVFDGSKEFIQFHYEPGAGYEEPDVYARVVFTERADIYEARFCQRISMGAEVNITENYGEGLQPVVWMSGKVIDYYSRIRRKLDSEDLKLSLREVNGLKVLTGRDPEKGFASEFWIDPKKAHHIVRYRHLNSNGELNVTREWAKVDNLWYVKRCVYRLKMKNAEIPQDKKVELVFDSFEPIETIPKEVFSIHALGLPKWAWICAKDPKDPDEENIRYEPDPNFNRSKVEKVVGKLPKVLPLK